MNQYLHALLQHGLADRLAVHVHDAVSLLPGGLLAARAQFGGEVHTCFQGEVTEDKLYQRMAQFAAHGLVGKVVSAEGVAMKQRDRMAVQLGDINIRQQVEAEALGKRLSNHEIAVAMLKKQGDARAGESFEEIERGLNRGRDGRVVTHPDFDKIAQDIKRIRFEHTRFEGE